MAVIDLKNTTVKLYDGKDLDTTGIVAIPIVAVDGDLSVQGKIMASPDAPITLTLLAGADESLATTVTERSIVVQLEVISSAVITTAAALVTHIATVAAAFALIDLVATEAGTGILEAVSAVTVTNPNNISVKIGEGNLTYSEKRPVEFKLDKGVLDTVRTADEEPIDVSFDFTWEYITAATGAGVPTVEDALKRLSDASAWFNASSDACRPTCINISVDNNPTCAGVQKEVLEIYEFYHETLDHDMDAGQVSCSGRANSQYATSVRIT